MLNFEEHDPHNFADKLEGRMLLNFRIVESNSLKINKTRANDGTTVQIS